MEGRSTSCTMCCARDIADYIDPRGHDVAGLHRTLPAGVGTRGPLAEKCPPHHRLSERQHFADLEAASQQSGKFAAS